MNETLIGVECRACGYRAHPYQSYGCESCGATADRLIEVALSGSGTVTSSAVVHQQTERSAEVPFTVVAVVLDDGPFVRGVLSSVADASLRDAKVYARFDHEANDFRFALRDEVPSRA
ncbi:Zn-ribbon domain-containing OB-fold protein [Dactylosporangium sp. CA-092794]|uniref:Zn-ribbon domain-containing OB-fold protein n=1 Tax=Dactylosporangium sp. CA-092794 TaxID=3239929 RepID=UPI003D91E1CD